MKILTIAFVVIALLAVHAIAKSDGDKRARLVSQAKQLKDTKTKQMRSLLKRFVYEPSDERQSAHVDTKDLHERLALEKKKLWSEFNNLFLSYASKHNK